MVARQRWMLAFVFGFGWAALTMYVVRDVIVAFRPHLVREPAFHYYSLALVIISTLFGIVASRYLPESSLMLATVALGGYLLAVAANGLVPLLGGTPLPPYAFFLILLCAWLLGYVVQTLLIRQKEVGLKGEKLLSK